MISEKPRTGAAGALLNVYEQAITEFKKVIEDIPDKALTTVIDPNTDDEDGRSIQTILSHVVSCGYNYATSIYHLKGFPIKSPDKVIRPSIEEYMKDLNKVFTYTENIFEEIKDDELEQTDNFLKITTDWGQLYDIEQMTEHAIVHVLRHKQQVKKIKQHHLN